MAVYNGISWLALAGFGFVTSTAIYRLTGDASFGIWATIASLRAMMLWLDGGLAMGVVRDAALWRAAPQSAIDRIQAAQLAYRLIGLAAMVVGLVASPLPAALLGLSGRLAAEAQMLTILLAIDAGIALAGSPVTAILRGWQRFDLLAIGSVGHAALGIALLLVGVNLGGLVGAALGLVVARAFVTVAYAAWLWKINRPLLQGRSDRRQARSILRFAVPLWLVSFGTLVGQSTDVPVVGLFFGATAAGHFAVGAIPPSVLVGALWMLIDTMYPRLVTTHVSAAPLRLLVFAASFLGALGLAILALSAAPVLRLWLGEDPALAQQVMGLYAVTWILNMPVHVLSLAAIAQNNHRILAPIVLVEAGANLILSVALALWVGPVGPALATVVTLAISNLVVVPWLLLGRMRFPAMEFVKATVFGFAFGAVVAAGVWLIASSTTSSDLARVLVAAAVPSVLVVAMGLLWLRDQGLVYRLVAVAFDGGLLQVWREWKEVHAARRRIAEIRASGGFTSSDQPLVTVRIATYNRGRLVAERAISSAIAQTYGNLEILVVGDHCDAETEAAVRSVDDPRIVFHNLPARGIYPDDPSRRWMVAGAAPMNWALEHASGEWIAPLDDDDEFTPDHVEQLLRAARENRAEFVYAVAESEDEPGVWRRLGSWPLREGQIVHAAVMYRSELRFIKHSVDSWRLGQPGDWNLWKRMKRSGVRMAFTDHVVVRHFVENREARGMAGAVTRS